jgi:PfaB family protein
MNPIAIIGAGCLFPGAQTPEEFWRNLVAETDSTSAATIAEMGVPVATFYHPAKGQGDKFYALRGGYVRDFVFDATGYQLPPEFLNALDSLFHWPLYVAREALRDSGYLTDSGYWQSDVRAKTGVVLGNLSFPTKKSHHLFAPMYHTALTNTIRELLRDPQFQLPRLDPPTENTLANALISGYPAAIVAQALGLSHTHLALDAACASSLYAVKLACDYLQAGKTDLMLAGAVSCADPLFIKIGFSIFQAYPPNDQSSPLDKTSQGLISSEGAGMFVLKRLADAERDGNKIYAVLRGIGLSNDGKGKHILTPNPKGQTLAFERAYANAQIPPENIDYIECHATGTPLGDITELNSMESFFGARKASPLVGSAKSNIGHLLTAAGMGGMLKAILGMAHNRIPATIKIENPHASQNNVIGAQHIVRQARAWPNGRESKRAAVSAFGFGGTNAHLVMENKPSAQLDSKNPTPLKPLAITGMAAHFGACADLKALRQALYSGQQLFTALPEKRWKGLETETELLKQYGLAAPPQGAYIADFEMDFLHFKIPPNDADQPIPQQLLMLKVADAALSDARVKPGSNVAVLIAMETELALHEIRGRVDLTWQIPAALERAGVSLSAEQAGQLEHHAKDSLHTLALVNQYTSFIGNIMASRIAALWDFSGPAFTISAAENSVSKALEVAQMMLNSGEVEAVLLGAVDLAGSVEHVLVRQQMHPLESGAPTLSFDTNSNGWLLGEGAGALVLRRAADAPQHYATIEALASGAATAEGVAETAQRVLQAAAIPAKDVGFVEVNASGFPYQDEAEMRGLASAYSDTSPVMASVKAHIGHTFAAAGVASLIRAALCLAERYVPGTPNWNAPKQPLPFTVAEHAQPWLNAERVAAVSILSHDQTCAHVILRARETHALPNATQYQPIESLRLIPLAAPDVATLQTQLQALLSADSVPQVAQAAWKNYQAHSDAPQRVMLLARNSAELQREVALAQAAAQAHKELVTPNGSSYAPQPLRGPVAFVYPGAFNSYSFIGQDLFYLFPNLYARFAQITRGPARALGAEALYPRRLTRYSADERKALDKALVEDAMAMVASGTSLATLYTLIMREWFNVQPAAALGYSLGEAAMMWALGVWTHGDDATQALRDSELFKTRIAGPKRAVREAWKIDPSVPDHNIWSAYVVLASVAQVRECLKDEPRAFITIINTPNELVLAGDPAACQRVIARLNCQAMRAPFDHVIHCPPMQTEYGGFDALHHWPVQALPNTTCYSAADYAPTELTEETIARKVSTVTCSPVDFPRLVQRVYDDGARIFVELGPRRTCSRWIDAILADAPHVAVGINQKGESDETALLRLLARLAAHHAPLNLAPLFATSGASVTKAGFPKRIVLGESRLADTLLTPENRACFSQLLRRPATPRPSPNIAAELEPLRRAWQAWITRSATSPSPALSTGKTPVTSAPASLAPVPDTFLRADARALSPELLKLLQGFAPANKAAPSNTTLAPPSTPATAKTPKPASVIWDYDDLLKYSSGPIADVFGPEYASIDAYARRVRLPMPPYLLVTRITKLNAKLGEYKPAQITTEYDIPYDAWYSVDGQIPWAVAVESGQCDLMLISYLGIDFENKGALVYRLLDCTMTFLADLPREGQTLRYDISINSYARSGDNLLFFFSYDCYVGDKMVLKMRGGCAGFFSDEDLARGKGIIRTEAELAARAKIQKQHFAPLLTSARATFGRAELDALSAGDLTACFGPHYAQPGRNPSLRPPRGQMLMLDRVVDIDPNGGPWGLGAVIAEHDLAPDNWYFPCHFKDDEVMAGSLMAEGCGQFMQFYMLYLGLHTHTQDARFQPIPGLSQVVRCRGQVTPMHGKLIYHMEITGIGLEPYPYAKANVDIILNGKVIVNFTDLGLQLVEKTPPAPPMEVKPTALFTERHITEFALGSLEKCFGPEYARYDRTRAPRTPNGDLQLISRVLSVSGQRGEVTAGSSLVTEYDVPANPWYCQQNAYPTAPYSILMEIGLQPCGFLSAHLGSTLPYPDENFYFRNLDGNGKFLREMDVRGQTITNRVRLLSSTAIQGIIIQKFTYELSRGGQPFYAGEAAFGYFKPEALINQVGLDRGNSPAPLGLTTALPLTLDLRAPTLFHAPANQPYYKLSGGQFHYLDEAQIAPNGGKFGQGYVFARKTINPRDWFFRAHFHQDPVMPGSLGVEAMLQALQAYAVHTGVGRQFRNPRFAHAEGHNTIWKYRGQIVPTNKSMALEIHLTKTETTPNRITLYGEASLWKENLRIYDVKPLALSVVEAA